MQRILREETEFLRGQINETTSIFGQTPREVKVVYGRSDIPV